MTEENCLFCRIVSGELAAVVVFEDQNTLAFLDHRPLFFGHTLLVPRRRKDGLKGFFWPRTKYKTQEEMEVVQQKIAAALEKTKRSK